MESSSAIYLSVPALPTYWNFQGCRGAGCPEQTTHDSGTAEVLERPYHGESVRELPIIGRVRIPLRLTEGLTRGFSWYNLDLFISPSNQKIVV